ncbi:MAG: hypothetical protein DMG67_17085 [Acidobacteria bacterium]|nr:MAG: hypothetical protein DMG67_17085 [Acidobacteriota bacterium]
MTSLKSWPLSKVRPQLVDLALLVLQHVRVDQAHQLPRLHRAQYQERGEERRLLVSSACSTTG